MHVIHFIPKLSCVKFSLLLDDESEALRANGKFVMGCLVSPALLRKGSSMWPSTCLWNPLFNLVFDLSQVEPSLNSSCSVSLSSEPDWVSHQYLSSLKTLCEAAKLSTGGLWDAAPLLVTLALSDVSDYSIYSRSVACHKLSNYYTNPHT